MPGTSATPRSSGVRLLTLREDHTGPLRAGFASGPFGRCLIGAIGPDLCHLSFADGSVRTAWKELSTAWPRARILRDDRSAELWSKRLFGRGKGATAPVRCQVRGTAFQLRVWRELLRIPSGGRVTYGELAARVGHPKAARAVGSAVGDNPIAWLIPCHRVVRGSGGLGGYHWGVGRKRAMLAHESVSGCLGTSASHS